MSLQLEIEAARTSFHENALGLAELFHSQHGPIAIDLAQRAIRVESQAKLNATGRPGPNVITGRLRGSITWRLGHDEIGLYADIGSNVEYAIYVEQGTSRAPAYPYLLPALEAAGV